MGETVSFTSNGDEVEGYLAVPAGRLGPRSARRPGVVGPGAADQTRRRSARGSEGFTALAPDLYRGEIAEHTEMDKAAQLMNDAAARSGRARHGRCRSTTCSHTRR